LPSPPDDRFSRVNAHAEATLSENMPPASKPTASRSCINRSMVIPHSLEARIVDYSSEKSISIQPRPEHRRTLCRERQKRFDAPETGAGALTQRHDRSIGTAV